MTATLRKGFDCTGVCVVYFCHDGAGRFLMARRNANTRDEHGRWDIGGGGIEFGDTVEATIHKEIAEEYCTEVLDIAFLGYRDVHRVHAGEPTHWIALDFAVRVNPATVRNGEPHKFDDVRWFTFATMPPAPEVHSQFPEFLERYRERLVHLERIPVG